MQSGGEEEEELQPFLLASEQTDGRSNSCLPLSLRRPSRRRRSLSHEGFQLARPVRIWPQVHSSPELLHRRHVPKDHTSGLGAAAEKRAAARAAEKMAMEKAAAERAEAEKAAMEKAAADMEAAEKQAAEKETAEKEAAEQENAEKQLVRTLSKLGSAFRWNRS